MHRPIAHARILRRINAFAPFRIARSHFGRVVFAKFLSTPRHVKSLICPFLGRWWCKTRFLSDYYVVSLLIVNRKFRRGIRRARKGVQHCCLCCVGLNQQDNNTRYILAYTFMTMYAVDFDVIIVRITMQISPCYTSSVSYGSSVDEFYI